MHELVLVISQGSASRPARHINIAEMLKFSDRELSSYRRTSPGI
jgi:hypothetical protein